MAQQKFTERWVVNLVESLDAHLDEETKATVMESCGRACACGGAISSTEDCAGNVDKLLSTLEKRIGKGSARRDGDVVHVVYPKCLWSSWADSQKR